MSIRLRYFQTDATFNTIPKVYEYISLIQETEQLHTHNHTYQFVTPTFAQSVADVIEESANTKQALEDHIDDKNNPHEVTKDQVGLGNVDNTSDLDKPISNAVQEVLDEIDNKHLVISSALNDLNSRILDNLNSIEELSQALDGTSEGLDNLSEVASQNSDSINELLKTIESNEYVISSSLNDLNTRILDNKEELDQLSNDIEENEEIVATALNDLNTRIIDLNTLIDEANQQLSTLETKFENSKIKIVNNGTNNTTISIDPNKLYVWGTVSSLTITLATPTDNTIVNEYMFEFTSGSTATTLSLPSTIQWQEEPQIEANMRYQVSIVNNMGLIVGV